MTTTVPDAPTETTRPARERLVRAAQELYGEQGVDATTPREVLERSGVGQGSLYHHFPSKTDLARTALRRTAQESLDEARTTLANGGSSSGRLRAYLAAPRDALAGSAVGRMTSDPVVMADPSLREPLAEYFTGLLDLVTVVLWEQGYTEAQAHDRAFTVVATVQGGYVLARALGDDTALERALRGVRTLCGLEEA